MIQNIRLNAVRLWTQLTWTQRLTILGLSGAVVGAIALLVMWANTPTYGVLFSGLSTQDAGAIVTQLNQSKVPYQLADGGTAIMVPQSMVDTTRLQLANQGLPQGDVVGFSLFDKTNIFQGDSFTEQINYTRALEGELTRTIGQISGVVYDRVNIVLPQQSLFSSQQDSPTASVLLKLSPGADLSSGQIGGIQHLVASAVQGMKADAVTVVDGNGTILNSTDSLNGAGGSGMTAMAAQTTYARNLEAQLMAMLDTVLGPDHAIVRVNDTMDFTQRELTSNTYAPQSSRSPVSESHLITNTAVGPGSTVGGVPGLASNVPTYGSTPPTSTNGYSQTQQNADIVYATSNTVAHVVQAPGAIQHLSVAVLVDSTSITNTREMATLQQAVASAAGLDPKRGDVLSINPVPFDNSVAAEAAKALAAQQQQAFIESIVRWAALLIVPLILLFLLRRLLVSRQEEDDDYPLVEEVDEEVALLAPAHQLTPQEQQRQLMQQSMSELAREKPDVVAGLIGRWIEEDRA